MDIIFLDTNKGREDEFSLGRISERNQMNSWISHSKYCWVIAFSILFIQTVSSGFGFYNMAVYMSFFAKELNLALDMVSISVSLFFVSGGVAGLFVAKLLSRWDVRLIMTLGAFISAVALYLIGYADSLSELYLLFILFGIGNTGVSIVVATFLITQWFPDSNRSIALSISSTGLSLGGVLLTPYTAYLLDRSGVQGTMPFLALLFFVLITPVVFLFIRQAPILGQSKSSTEFIDDIDYANAIRTRFFICLTLGYVLIMAAQVGGLTHLYNRFDEIAGISLASTSIQTLTVSSITGRLLGGWLLTRIKIKPFLFLNLLIQICGLALISISETSLLAFLSCVLLGVSVGNLLMLQPLWLAEAFSARIYPRVFALSNLYSVIGVAVGPYLIGLMFVSYDYGFAYAIAAVTSLLAGTIIAGAGSFKERA